MKKLVFMFVAVAAISFASCGNKTAANDGQQDTDTIPAVEQADSLSTPDSLQNDSVKTDSVK